MIVVVPKTVIFISLARQKASSFTLKAVLITQNISGLDRCGNYSLRICGCGNFLSLSCAKNPHIQVGTGQASRTTEASSLT